MAEHIESVGGASKDGSIMARLQELILFSAL